MQRMISGNCLAGILQVGYWKKEWRQYSSFDSIVTVHYKGTLINTRVRALETWKLNYPEAFQMNEVIEGWQIALQRMHVGDHWIVYIPYAMGYSTRIAVALFFSLLAGI